MNPGTTNVVPAQIPPTDSEAKQQIFQLLVEKAQLAAKQLLEKQTKEKRDKYYTKKKKDLKVAKATRKKNLRTNPAFKKRLANRMRKEAKLLHRVAKVSAEASVNAALYVINENE